MALAVHRHGKARVRVARLVREGTRHDVRELEVQAMVEGAFERSFTAGDNSGVVATDTIKNWVQIVARENLAAGPEVFGRALAGRMLEKYPQVARVTVTCRAVRWARAAIDGEPHPHTFLLDGNGVGLAEVVATRDAVVTASGVEGFTLMKTTESGWVGYLMDEATTLPETTDRVLATALDARWLWAGEPAAFEAANAAVLAAMLRAFATTYSRGVQDSLYRMAQAAMAAVPEVAQVTMLAPNKHYIPVNLAPFGRSADGCVFTPTDEPHGQIECVVTRE